MRVVVLRLKIGMGCEGYARLREEGLRERDGVVGLREKENKGYGGRVFCFTKAGI